MALSDDPTGVVTRGLQELMHRAARRAHRRAVRSSYAGNACSIQALAGFRWSDSKWENQAMSYRLRTSRLLLWLGVCALLIRASVPMLASWQAHSQGISLASVCYSHGVDRDAAMHHGTGAHGDSSPEPMPCCNGDFCALAGLAGLVPDLAATAVAPPSHFRIETLPPLSFHGRRDASAAWMAQRKQGPPGVA